MPWRRRCVYAAACAAGALLSCACSVLTPRFATPDLSVAGIEMQSGNLLQQSFRLSLQIHNPNDRPLPVERVRARLLLGGEELASGVTARPFVVPARGDAAFDMLISANLAAGFAQLASRLDARRGSVGYELDGVVRLDLPLLHSLPFHLQGELPLRDLR
ncbi:MAG TPA: LEA type 2 family protein [Steroidobacteraceae bacterium]|nr:LEA type 2 family protein [Steroidobacteraceae bacterium]